MWMGILPACKTVLHVCPLVPSEANLDLGLQMVVSHKSVLWINHRSSGLVMHPFWDKVSLCNSGWSGTHYVKQTGLKFRDLLSLPAEIKGMNHHTWPLFLCVSVLCLCVWKRTEEGTGWSGTRVAGGYEPSWVLETKLEGHLQKQQMLVATKPTFLHQYWLLFLLLTFFVLLH